MEQPAGAKIVLDLGSGGDFRFMFSGERATIPSNLVYTDSVFDIPSSGTIRGHAVAEATTIAAAKLCTDASTTPMLTARCSTSACIQQMETT